VCGGDRVAMSGGVGAEGGSEGDCGGAGKVGIEMNVSWYEMGKLQTFAGMENSKSQYEYGG